MTDKKVPTCGECVHADVCARVPYFTEFSRENPAYCNDFRENLTWIPVTERLPEERGFVLGFSVDKIVGEMHWDSDDGFYWAGSDEDAEPVAVTHWMPLPKPPGRKTEYENL